MAGNRLWQGRESIVAWQAVKQWMSVFLAYNKGFYRVAKRYAGENEGEGTTSLKWLRTVCGSSQTDLLHRLLFYWKREILIRLNRY